MKERKAIKLCFIFWNLERMIPFYFKSLYVLFLHPLSHIFSSKGLSIVHFSLLLLSRAGFRQKRPGWEHRWSFAICLHFGCGPRRPEMLKVLESLETSKL